MASYIWSGASRNCKYHIVKLEKTTRPKILGVWGVLNLKFFGWALILKSLWRGINNKGIWGKLIRSKYMKNKEFSFWLRQGAIGKKGGSQIWNSFRRVKNILFQNISWFFGSGNRILLGKDCIIGAGESPPGTVELIQHLNRRGIFVLS